MHCTVHQQNEASGACVYCGKLFCESCLIELDGKYYCKEHVQQLFRERQGVNHDIPTLPPQPKPHYEQDATCNHYREGYPNVIINNNNINTNTNTNQNLHSGYQEMFSPKDRVVTLLLCLFFGVAGFHRFYVGKIGTGLIWLFTGGFFGIGYIIDLIMIIFGTFRDSRGLRIR